ncbi:hypothetical protein [Pseudaestuariivita rosea]|uniref:hypothetical protein n=1 Tax=Pseudaestuariivita rosea TaxID=2763263 RepID=UPI001ABA5CF8|nr:hypothetical protein [Pseudaestuariivita rosea]
MLQLLGLGCREAAGIAAIRSPRSEVFQGNSQVADNPDFHCENPNDRLRTLTDIRHSVAGNKTVLVLTDFVPQAMLGANRIC